MQVSVALFGAESDGLAVAPLLGDGAVSAEESLPFSVFLCHLGDVALNRSLGFWSPQVWMLLFLCAGALHGISDQR